MSSGNYGTYLGYKSFQEKIKGLYVCKSGDTMTGDLNMSCNDITNVSNLSFCENGTIIGDVSFNGTLSLDCNLLNDVSGINFCDGTYIGHGSSFDISTNEVLKINNNAIIVNTDGKIGIGKEPDTVVLLDINGGTIIRGRLNMEDKGGSGEYNVLFNNAGFTVLRAAPSTNSIVIRDSTLSQLYASFDPSYVTLDNDTIINGNLDINSDTIRLRNRRIIATSTTDGSAGEICFDDSYAYFCVADNTWKRVNLSSW